MKKSYILFISIIWSVVLFAQNPVQISQGKAWEIVKEKVLQGDTTEVHVYVSNAVCKAESQIKTVYEDVNTPDFDSWFFFIDDVPFGDWEHPCRYVFVNSVDGTYIVQNHRRPPLLDTMTNLVWKKAVDDNRSISKITSGQKSVTSKTSNTATYDYAVIINGGMNKDQNEERYWHHCSDIYKTLINQYGYIKNHIYVIMSDGTNPAVDMKTTEGTYASSNLDLDEDGVADIQYAATKSNISNVFNLLQQRMVSTDNLFVYVTDHGGEFDNGSGSFIYLWGEETMTPSELNTQLNKVNAAKINVCLMQCRSGGFIPTLQASNRVITTSCASHEDAHGDSSYSNFAFHWVSAVAGVNPNGYTANADSNNDGIVSMNEAFNYAYALDHILETPQYSSTPTSLGNSLSLYNETFRGTYYNGTSTKNIVLSVPLYTNYGGFVEINTPNLIGATVTRDGSTNPYIWTYNTSTGYLKASFPPSTGGTIVVHITRNGKTYNLPIIATLNSGYLSIDLGEGQMTVSLVPDASEEDFMSIPDISSITSKADNLFWTLEVYGALTGEKVYKQDVSGDSLTIDTSGWKPGIYIVKAIVDGQLLSEKVVVK
ncbi:MAG: T9SS type A sorting domain-containing protein [Prevotella sp.]|nr:T9SS type A sorting domain-containing protein [Prevotella sp.]